MKQNEEELREVQSARRQQVQVIKEHWCILYIVHTLCTETAGPSYLYLRTKRAWMYTIQCMGVWYILYSHVQLVLPLSFVLTFLLSVTPYTLSRWSTLVRSTITITITITIGIQVIDTCKKYSIDRSSKEVSKAAWALHLVPEEWNFLRRVNW